MLPDRKEILHEPETTIEVESTRPLRDKEQELVVAQRMRRGFEKEVFSLTPISWSADISVVRSGRPSWIHSFENIVVNELDRRVSFDVHLNPYRIAREAYTKRRGMDEADLSEVIGFYLKLCALRHEITKGDRRDMLFGGKRLSEYEFNEALWNDDELWPFAGGFYIVQVLKKDWKDEVEEAEVGEKQTKLGELLGKIKKVFKLG